MKKCANCGFESPDEALSCPSCSTDTFTSTSPEALGHIISPEEQRYWERMTFRQFAILFVRIQAMWLLFYALLDATYLPRFFTSPIQGPYYTSLSPAARSDLIMLILRLTGFTFLYQSMS
jgi:RNA polymerase subunit RPABC4/transcription elongation factor Spt4